MRRISKSWAVFHRNSLNAEDRTETFFYLDEAHEYADENLEILLNQGRKYKTGVIVAHQFLDQLDGRTRQALLANASIKMVGGLSHKDAQAFAREMQTSTAFLSELRKEDTHTQFGLWIKNVILKAVSLSVPFGAMAKPQKMGQAARQKQRTINRQKYCTRNQPIAKTPTQTQPRPETPTRISGKGGADHKAIQNHLKTIAHEFGFGVEIEAACQNSAGLIDVMIIGDSVSFAVEISVTTPKTHEFEKPQEMPERGRGSYPLRQ